MKYRKYLLPAVLTVSVLSASYSTAVFAADTASVTTQNGETVSDSEKENTEDSGNTSYKADGEKVETLDNAGESYAYFTDSTAVSDKKTDGKNSVYQRKRLAVVTDDTSIRDTFDAEDTVYDKNMGAYVMTYDSAADTRKAEKKLEKKYGKSAVFPDRVLKSSAAGTTGDSGEDYVSWGTGVMHLNQTRDSANADPLLKNTVTVAVLDSGIYKDHEIFSGRTILSGSRQIITSPYLGARALYSTDYADDYWHGTHVSGIIADGTSDQVNFLILKILDENGEGSEFGLAAAFDYINSNFQKTVRVINISGGINGLKPGTAEYRWIDQKLKRLYRNGILVVTASGNDGKNIKNTGTYPADSKYAYAVGAVNSANKRASFSNYGSDLDFAAPGVSVKSAFVSGNDEYVAESGTSMAAPHVTAAAAMIRLYLPKYSVSQVKNVLKKFATDLGTSGYDKYYGYGEVVLPQVQEQTITTSSDAYEVNQETESSFSLNASAHTGLKYGSRNKNVATVDKTGTVHIVGKGTAKIVIKARSSLRYAYAKKTVTVRVQ